MTDPLHNSAAHQAALAIEQLGSAVLKIGQPMTAAAADALLPLVGRNPDMASLTARRIPPSLTDSPAFDAVLEAQLRARAGLFPLTDHSDN